VGALKSWLTRRLCVVAAGALLLAGIGAARAIAQSPVPSDAAIRNILIDRIDTYRQSVGMVVGVIEPAGRRLVAYGKLEAGDPRPLDGDTLFEIGSVTKVFTALLLVDMARRGEVLLDDPVVKYLPPETKLQERNGRAVSLFDLATHTSSLPRMPSNFAPRDAANPYADYTIGQLDEFLSAHVPSRDIGSQFEYSNLGVALLGRALARRANLDYETLVRSRIAEPLGMASTVITLSPPLQARLAAGHDGALARVANWDLGIFAGAGALRSSASDLLTFLAANLGTTQTPLAPALADMLRARGPIGSAGEIALGWAVLKRPGRDIVWHDGQTGGYHAFIGYDAKARIGIVVLSNTSVDNGDVGFHLLDPSIPLKRLRKEIAVDPRLFDGYVGRYALAPNLILTVTSEGGRLYVQVTGQARFQVFAESERKYFYRVVDAQITFETDDQGRAVRLILHQFGMDIPGKRIE
jgi:CubicO group peptidase (beta-lactamase class C family)